MSDSFLAVVNMRAADASNTAGMTHSCYDFDPLPLPETLPPTVSVEAKPGRGRILTMNQPAAAGDCVLAEAPICWWVDVDRQDDCCARCLKADLPLGGHAGCEVCRSAVWCSAACGLEDEARHAGVCKVLSAAMDPAKSEGEQLDPDALNLLTFCAHALAVREASPADWAKIMGLSSVGVSLSEAERTACVQVTARLKAAGVASMLEGGPLLYLVQKLCKRDKASNFCLAMPPSESGGDRNSSDDDDDDDDDDSDDSDDSDDQKLSGGWVMASRRVRGYGCYPTLAFCNHSCLPTVSRFDALDDDSRDPAKPSNPVLAAPLSTGACVGPLAAAANGAHTVPASAFSRPPFSLTTRFVALHDLPAGAELCISYMPLGDELSERQARLQEEYGFKCDCPRCIVEEDDDEHGEGCTNHDHAHDHSDHGHEHEHGGARGREAGDGHHEHDHAMPDRARDTAGANIGCGHDHADGECCAGEEKETAAAGVDLTYVSLFVLKHVCGECLGTMAPIAGKGADAPCVCNRCGVTRTQQEFLERVESHFNGEESDSED